jgi:hypothetical protein
MASPAGAPAPPRHLPPPAAGRNGRCLRSGDACRRGRAGSGARLPRRLRTAAWPAKARSRNSRCLPSRAAGWPNRAAVRAAASAAPAGVRHRRSPGSARGWLRAARQRACARRSAAAGPAGWTGSGGCPRASGVRSSSRQVSPAGGSPPQRQAPVPCNAGSTGPGAGGDGATPPIPGIAGNSCTLPLIFSSPPFNSMCETSLSPSRTR